MTENGIYTSSELGDNSENIFYALFTPLLSLLKISTQKVIFPIASNINRSMEFIIKMINQGKFTPLIDRTYPIDQISEAFEYVISGQKLGNVIITFE
jgi:NADPH:quinone reductase-like Zn-dependent oxidoreductase